MQNILSLAAKKIKPWIKAQKVQDVILFGSVMRGKSNPSDIDLCILAGKSDEKRALDLIDSLGKLADNLKLKSHISLLTSDDFVAGNTLAKTLLAEGYSLKHKERFSSVIGFAAKSLFVYTLKHFSSSERVKFHYMLKGRYGSKGILKETKGEFLGAGSITVPINKEDLLKDVFDRWKVKYTVSRILIG